MQASNLRFSCSDRAAHTRVHRHQRHGACRQLRGRPCCSIVSQRLAANSSDTRGWRVPVEVEVECTSWTSRKLYARVQINAPVNVVWGCLTDYEHLQTFIPSLEVNKCLERRPKGAVLYQVGAQEVALGVKFSAAVTLEIKEHPEGLRDDLCRVDNKPGDCHFPIPRNTLSGQRASDISFALLDGDFEAFRGIWRMQRATTAGDATLLTYSVYVQPQKWLPVGLIQSRIQKEIQGNLDAVRRHAERLLQQQTQVLLQKQRQQQQQQQQGQH